jgi:putative tryptophan/tyrosine transport system substrate-binding protein
MRRRNFLGVLGLAVVWPRVAWAQAKPARIGVLVLGNPDPAPYLKGLRDGLRELGYVEGQSFVIELRSADRNPDRLLPLATELAASKVDVIVGFQTPAAAAAKQATTDIPVVAMAGDMIGTGIVASLARPGGNVTGVISAGGELGVKNLELIREMFPAARRVGVLLNVTDPFNVPFLRNIQDGAHSLNFEITPFKFSGPNEFDPAFAEMERSNTDAIIVQPSLPHERMAELAIKHRLPSFAPNPVFAAVGGLMAYSADYDELYRECAVFVDKILKGRKPAELPVQLPTKFWLAVNLKTAKVIGVTVLPAMLIRADQVIE